MEAGEKLESRVESLDESDLSLAEKYETLQQAYIERQQEVQELEKDHEEVTDRLEGAMKVAESGRRTAVTRSCVR